MSCSEDFFTQFTPLTREGRPVRDDDGLLVFVRRTDGEYVSFHDSQIHMEGLDSYIKNDIMTKARNAVESSSVDQYGLHDTNSDHDINPANSIMLHPQLHQNCQVLQTNVQCSPMQVISPHVMHTQHNVLQLQQQSHHHSSTLLQQNQLQLQHLKNPSQQLCAATTGPQAQTHQQHAVHRRADGEHNLTEHALNKTDDAPSTMIIPPDYMSCTTESTIVQTSANTTPAPMYTKPGVIGGRENVVKSEQVHNCIMGESQETLRGCNPPPISGATKTTQPPQDVVWMNIKTPEARMRDKIATQNLIKIVTRPDTQAKLADKSTKKKVVWQEIGEEMGRLGFIFENPGDKCSQKWRNIERGYKDYVMRRSMPDTGTKREPELYNLLTQVLKGKHVYESVPASSGEGEEDGPSNQDLIDEFVDMAPSPREVGGTESVTPNAGDCQGQISPVTMSASQLTGPDICIPKDTDLSDSPSSSRNEHYGSFAQVLAEVKLQRSHMSKMESVLLTVQQLLEEQKRDREAMHVESRERFAELKALIENNQKEKMKFMNDFLKTIQFGKGGKRKRIHVDGLDNCSDK
ncbi:unnamed protein product [Lymnaea stagnalis]|uniref:Myb/SANT-like DNA-binding domain-containing protein n=1 Tax=Lymnaea stagnalis TaxID=6523 RepID=A0AAV2HR25_LYMST